MAVSSFALCVHPCRSPGLKFFFGGGGWAQESHVVENVAALRPWQEILRGKYRTKSIIRGSWAIDDAIRPGGVGGGKAG